MKTLKQVTDDCFIDGVLYACQEIVISHGQDTMACEIMRGAGTEKEFFRAQKNTGHETQKMNQVIREAFRRRR